MTRALAPDVAAKLKQWEGRRLVAYQDQAGVWTIGDGHTGPDVTAGLVWTPEQADAAFDADTLEARSTVESLVSVPLTDNEFGALVSFTYNVGAQAFKSSDLLKKLNESNYTCVPDEMARWKFVTVNGKKIVDKGLVNRRNAEGGLWVGGAHVASSNISPDPPTPWYATPRAKALTTAAAGISGTAVTQAAGQLQGLAAYSHVFLWGFIALSVIGVVIGIVKHKDGQ